MRYIVASRTMPATLIEQECKKVGAGNIRIASPLKQVMCDLEPAAVEKLSSVPGIVLREPKQVKLDVSPSQTGQIGVITTPERAAQAGVLQPVYAASQGSLFTALYDLRASVSPPVTGSIATAVILDTGMRKTHVGLRGKVLYEEDLTGGGDPEDVFDHGTGVAYLLGGGIHALGQESGVAPGAKFMNLKVIGDDGVGTDEDVIIGLGRALEIWQDAVDRGLHYTDPEYPNGINMSFGTEDDGDPDNPIRLAITEIWEAAGNYLYMAAAAGNSGPNPGTILLPGACPEVWTIGALTFEPFEIWQYSSRGPVAEEGIVKPDACCVGISILTASAASDNAFTVKSGTSFSCPLGMGFVALLAEYAARYGFADQLLNMDRQGWETFTASVSRKPSGAPAGKDYIYGWGMPMGDLAARAIGVNGMDFSQAITAMLGVGMMGAVMGSLARAD